MLPQTFSTATTRSAAEALVDEHAANPTRSVRTAATATPRFMNSLPNGGRKNLTHNENECQYRYDPAARQPSGSRPARRRSSPPRSSGVSSVETNTAESSVENTACETAPAAKAA